MTFRARIERTADEKRSKIILAFDFPFQAPENREELFLRARRTLEAVSPYVCAVKFNRHLILPLGTFDGVQKLVEIVHEAGLTALMDCKINDIGSTNEAIAEYYYAAGFDALIANPFVGWDEGLKPVFDVSRRLQRGLILLVYMSHKGAWEGYGQTVHDTETEKDIPQYLLFAEKALRWGADGAVVGATYPEKIREIKCILGDKVPIYSPGVGVQGGKVESALRSGARYLIVGRAITLSEDPAKMAKRIRDVADGCQ